MNSHPATYYHYEPLLHYDIKQARYPHLHHDVYAIIMFMLMIMITTRIIIMMMMFLLMIMMIMAARTIMNLEMSKNLVKEAQAIMNVNDKALVS